jgi:IS30 family transposase
MSIPSARLLRSRNAKAIAPSLWGRIEPYIRCDWSPEQIAGHCPIGHEAGVSLRKNIGQWEGDTVIGAGDKQAIVTMLVRKSGMALLAKAPFKRADLVAQAIEQRLKPYTSVVKTLTHDNGKKF